MKTAYHFQIRKDGNRVEWDLIKAHLRQLSDWTAAVNLSKKSARFYKAEVRLTEGGNPQRANGHYFHHRRL
jgi:hypothetical protein